MNQAPFLAGRAAETSTYNGAECAVRYGQLSDEYLALDTRTGLLDLTYRSFIGATGDDRATFLNGQLSNDIVSLPAGTGCAACLLTPQGRTVAMLAVYNLGDELVVALDETVLAGTHEALERFLIADDCELVLRHAERTIGVVGPTALDTLEQAGVVVPSDAPQWSATVVRLDGQQNSQEATQQLATVFGRDDLRVPYFEVIADDSEAAGLWQALEAAGGVPVGSAALDIVRIESGTPLYGIDVDESRIALEARLEWAIHFAKGCYVGQEVIERAVSRGRINRRLCLLTSEGEVGAGDAVQLPEGVEAIGAVTSFAVSPKSGNLCFAYLPIASSEVGTALQVCSASGLIAAEVLHWPRPLVMTGRQTPRA